MNVVTLKKHRYRDELKHVGDKYEINSKSIVVLYRALGWVTEVPPELKVFTKESTEIKLLNPIPQPNPMRAYPNKDVGKKSNKGKYQRKDLRTEK